MFSQGLGRFPGQKNRRFITNLNIRAFGNSKEKIVGVCFLLSTHPTCIVNRDE